MEGQTSSESGTGRLPHLVLLALGLLFFLLGARLLNEPIVVYGFDGAAWFEHLQRLEVLEAWRQRGETGWLEALRIADNYFPPGLFLVTNVLIAPFGHTLFAVSATGVLWLLLLGCALASCARSLTGDASAGWLALAGGCLLPAAHAYAIHYYLDLPMTALLWSAVAVALRSWAERPLLGGLSVSALVLTAALVKWTALALAAPLLLGVMFCATRRSGRGPQRFGRRRLLGALVSAGGGVLGLLLILGLLGEGSSLDEMAHEIGLLSTDVPVGLPLFQFFGALFDAVQSGGGGSRAWLSDGSWYLNRTIFSVFSPLGSVSLGAGFILWLVRCRAGAGLVFGTVLGFCLLHLGVIELLDDRFLLPFAPVVVLVSAMGFSTLKTPVRSWTVGLVGLLLLAVALEFHHGVLPSPGASREEDRHSPEDDRPPTLRRGLWLADSDGQAGWASRRTAQPAHMDIRAELLDELRRRGVGRLREEAGHAGYAPLHEPIWLRYEGQDAYLLGGGLPIEHHSGLCTEGGLQSEAALLPVAPGEEASPHPCLEGWERGPYWDLPPFPDSSKDGSTRSPPRLQLWLSNRVAKGSP